MSTIITPSEEQINIVVNDEKISINVESGDVIVNVTENIVEVSTVNGGYPLPTTVYSVFGRTGNIVATEGDYNLDKLSDVTLTSSTNGDVLSYDGTKWINKPVTGTGTVTSVNMSVPVGLQVSGNPIVSSGTLAVNFASGYSLPTTAKQTTWDAAYNDSIVSASVSGTTTKTLTLTQQDAGTITASWSDLAASGTVTSVGASVPTGLTISGSPIVTAGTLAFGLDTGYTIPLSTQLVPTGGSTGQILTKNSATNYDTIWSDNYADWTEQLRDTVKAEVAINKGQAVYISGANGTNQLVSLASNTTEPLSSKTLGLAMQNLAINGIGAIITEGLLGGLNTSTATAGDPVWLGVSGNLIYGLANKPVAPAHLVYIGVVTRSNINNGEIYVKIQNGFELQELHNVLISSVANNEGLFYETATTLWKNKSIATVLGYTPISLTSLSGVSPLSYNNTTGAFSIAQATTSVNGYLSSTDWTTFNGKQAALNGTGFVKATGTTISYDNSTYYLASNPNAYIALTGLSATAPLSYNNTTGGFTISQSGVSANGYLSSTDWNTFNDKQTSGSYITALSGEATASGPGSAAVTLSTSAVTGKILTGVNITGGSITATDSILVAFGKVQNQINGVLGGAIYQSTWNASTNNPTLTSGTGTKGYYYIVSVAGSTNLDGITDWKVGDWAIFNGATWDKVDNTDAVSSVNGFTGAVSLTTANISESGSLYYTEGRVSANTDVAANTAARHAAVTLGTANGLSLSTQALSLGLASTSATGALSSTDWNTFNLKQAALSGTGFVKISGSTISYDNSTYLTTSAASSTYVPYTGATGAVTLGAFDFTATNGYFTGMLQISYADISTGENRGLQLNNTGSGGKVYNLTSGLTGNNNADFVIRNSTNDVNNLILDGSSGAAIFSSTIDLTGNLTTTGSSSTAYGIISGIQFKNSFNSGNVKAKIVSINGADSDDMGLSFQTSTTTSNVSEKLRIVGSGAATFTSSVTATSFVKTSGTSSQFLKADGSVDSSTYLTTSSASSTYLPLAGGTLTGALNINVSSGTAMNVAGNAIFRGDTGVGTPRQLIISSGGSTPVYLEAKGYGANYQTDFGIKTYNSSGTAFEVFYADSSGRVGINRVAPSYQLDVNGTGRFEGALRVNGGTTTIYDSSEARLNFNTDVDGEQNSSWLYSDSNATLGSIGNVYIQALSTTVLSVLDFNNYGNNTANGVTGNVFIGTSVTQGIDKGAVLSLGGWTTSTGSASAFGRIAGRKENGTSGNQAGYLSFETANALVSQSTEKMRITSTGDVGIGTVTPSSLSGYRYLSINAASGGILDLMYNGTSRLQISAEGSGIYFSGIASIPMVFTTSNTTRLTIASTGASTFTNSVTATQLNATTTTAGYAAIFTNTNGASDSNGLLVKAGSTSSEYNVRFANQSDSTTFLTIKGNGNVGINTTGPSYKLDVQGQVGINSGSDTSFIIFRNYSSGAVTIQQFVQNGVGTIGSITFNGTAVLYNATSDYRLKQDFKDYNGLNIISSIKTYDFEWKSNKTRSYGVIAHELAEIMPSIVSGDKDAFDENGKVLPQGVDYSKIVPILIKSIQELNAEIQTLKNK